MASTISNPAAGSGRYHDTGMSSTRTAGPAPDSHSDRLRRLIAEGEDSGRAQDWALYDFLDRMAEKRRNAGK